MSAAANQTQRGGEPEAPGRRRLFFVLLIVIGIAGVQITSK